MFPCHGISKLESGIYSSIISQIIGIKIQSKKTTPLLAINKNPHGLWIQASMLKVHGHAKDQERNIYTWLWIDAFGTAWWT